MYFDFCTPEDLFDRHLNNALLTIAALLGDGGGVQYGNRQADRRKSGHHHMR